MPCGVRQMIILVDHVMDTYNRKQANSHQPSNRWASNQNGESDSSNKNFLHGASIAMLMDRQVNPTFMPMTRRWSWTNFTDLRKQNTNIVYNFPKFNFALTATSLGLASQLHEWNRQYQDVPDPAFVAVSHFNRLVILLLDTMS